MTRIDFYILPDETLDARFDFACRLIQKTFRMGHKIYVHCEDENQAEAFNKKLWDFQADSFIPHKRIDGEGADCDITVGHSEQTCEHHDILLNLDIKPHPYFSRFQRIAEIVVQEQRVLNATRETYRLYSNKNYPLHRHDMR